jgi:hypothetical protein
VSRNELEDEEVLIGNLRCPCGSENFKMMYPGQTHEYEGRTYPCTAEIDGHFFFLVKAICSECNLEHLLFDEHFHGWDGVMCHDIRKASLPRPPLTYWKCLSCGGLYHKVTLKIAFESKENFIEQSRGEFDKTKWPDAFQWIWISITCCKCGLESKDWVDYETA